MEFKSLYDDLIPPPNILTSIPFLAGINHLLYQVNVMEKSFLL